MTSELRSATSRANGAKSKGPKTAEGREKSSRNSFKHGFTSKKTIVLKCEKESEFQEMLGFYAETYQPGSPVERDLVHEMVACRWRMERLRLMETALLDSEMDRELPEGEPPADPGYQLAFAFRRLVDESRAVSLASRYESRLHRIHERSHRTLRELQQTRREKTSDPIPPTPVQPEPVPDPVVQIPKNDETNPAQLATTEPRLSASGFVPQAFLPVFRGQSCIAGKKNAGADASTTATAKPAGSTFSASGPMRNRHSRRCAAVRGFIAYRRRANRHRPSIRLSYNENLPQATSANDTL